MLRALQLFRRAIRDEVERPKFLKHEDGIGGAQDCDGVSRRMCSVAWAIAARTTAGAEIVISRR